MQGNPTIIGLLNQVLKNELTAINQYFLHARMLKNWGFRRLADKEYEESIGEMRHADRIIERILFLEGLPNLQDLGRLRIGEDVRETLEADLAAESAARELLLTAIAECERAQDYVTRQILRDILEDTEDHIDHCETQLSLIKNLGLQNYLQSIAAPVVGDGHGSS